uniref:Uncharacterized protein n=1 Tax=Arundo donax TaxID=35708 RepID=A0A0A9FW87_ARUDO
MSTKVIQYYHTPKLAKQKYFNTTNSHVLIP